MNKNKLIWAIALVLLISIPAAYAQGAAGNPILVMLINAAVVFIALFILQAILIPGKPEKEKVSVWVIIIVVSLLIAWFYGRNGLIWQTGPIGAFLAAYTWYKVLVNTLIIGAVIYFALGLTKIQQPTSPAGMTGYGLLIFIVAAVLAVKLGNNWIWAQGTIAELIKYFFGNEGILTTDKNRIFIFIGTAVLFTWFFNYLAVGKDNPKINIALAIIFAANMASGPNPFTVDSVKNLVLVIGTIVLGGNLSTSMSLVGKWKVLGYAIALVLMLWATSAVETAITPEGQAAVAQNGGGITGWIWGFFSVLFSNKGIIIIGVIILILLFVIFRGETRRRILTLSWGELKKRFNALHKNARFQRDSPPGREPQFFKENRMLFHALANYTTRSEITYRYWAVIKAGAAIWEQVKGEMLEFFDKDELGKEIIAYRGGGIKAGSRIKGWNELNLELVELLNKYLLLLTRMQVSSAFRLKEPAEYTLETGETVSLKDEIIALKQQIEKQHEVYKQRMTAYGIHHVLKAYKDVALNMSNVTGDVLEHPQKFARPGAEFLPGDQTNKPNKASVDAERLPADEVNQLGEVIDDIVEQKDSFGDLKNPKEYKRPRKLKNPNDIIDYPFIKLMDHLGKDWKGLAEDIRYGLHHPHSRTWEDYISALKKGIYYEWDDNKIQQSKAPTITAWAIDMRALGDPGLNKYWGRKHFYGDTQPISEENIPPHNPMPIFSSLGLKKYLIEAATKDITDKKILIEYLNKIHADSGTPEKELPEHPMGVYLGEEAAKAEGGPR